MVKRKASPSGSHDDHSSPFAKQSRKLEAGPSEAEDEFQQVTLPDFVERYRVQGMGYGADVYYQPDVILN